MRILIFSTAYLPFVGGAEVAIKEITDRLPEHQFELITVNLDGKQKTEEKIGNVLVRRIGSGKVSKYFFPWQAAATTSKLHKEKSYDFVWAMMASQGGMAAARFKTFFPKVPFLLTLQEGDDFSSLAYSLRLLGPRLFGVFKLADYCQAISNYLAKWSREMGFLGQPLVIPNGVNLEKFKNFKTKLSNKEEKIIIHTGRLVEKNGVADLIKSLIYLPNEVRLQLLGGGGDELGLRSLAANLGVLSRVEFLGHVTPERVAEYLLKADIFARPSLSEGLGISFLEAMGAGLPTIATPVGGIPDFLKHLETGFLCQARNPQSLAEQVKFIINEANREKVEEIIRRARVLIEEKYNWDTVSRQMDQLFQKAKI